jgi:phage terminase large subunit
MTQLDAVAKFPEKMRGLFLPYRYKVFYGGRGSGKSWAFARALLVKAAEKPMRILCCREVQKSIKQSVHQLLKDQVQELGLGYLFEITEIAIKGLNGSEFYFSGLATHTSESIKSYEGIDIVWIEEGATISKKSLDILLPTIRKPNSEIWISMNPELDTDEVYARFIHTPAPESLVVKVNYSDNPWFPEVLDKERLECLRYDPKSYGHIWEGNPKSVVDGAIYADEYQAMVDEHRITLVKPDPVLKSHIVMDLGWNDAMAIIVCQRAGSECRITHYIEETHQTLDWYSTAIRNLNLNWGRMYMPHDAVHKDYKTGKSAAEIMTQLGWDVDIVPIGDVEHGIRLTRMLLPKVWMDKENTKRLQECLKRYRRSINATTHHPGSPLHDEYSHGADAARYLATCVDSMRNDNTKRRRPIEAGASSWMA